MIFDSVLELSVEQLIRALNKKLLMECMGIQSTLPPTSRALVDMLTAEVRPNELKGSLSFDEILPRSTLWRREPKTFCAK